MHRQNRCGHATRRAVCTPNPSKSYPRHNDNWALIHTSTPQRSWTTKKSRVVTSSGQPPLFSGNNGSGQALRSSEGHAVSTHVIAVLQREQAKGKIETNSARTTKQKLASTAISLQVITAILQNRSMGRRANRPGTRALTYPRTVVCSTLGKTFV